MNRDEVQEYIEARYPDFTVKAKKTIICRNSRIFMLDICNGQILDKIVVKISRNHHPREVALEFANFSRFYHGCKDEAVLSPKPLFVDAENRILAMSYVQGVNLAHMLHEVRPVSLQYLNRAADLSGIALARFHALFLWGVDSFYDRFLSGYCREMHVTLSQDDLWLIARARMAYIRRAQDLTRKGRCGWQPKLEQMYLQTFSRDWLDQGDIFSKWPKMDWAKKA